MSVEENKRVSERYHELDSSNFDEILTPDFRGQHGNNGHTWDLESHRANWHKNSGTDVIHEQFGEGDKICTRFSRNTVFQGVEITADALHIKTFRDGKICHIWEFVDMNYVLEQVKAKKQE